MEQGGAGAEGCRPPIPLLPRLRTLPHPRPALGWHSTTSVPLPPTPLVPASPLHPFLFRLMIVQLASASPPHSPCPTHLSITFHF